MRLTAITFEHPAPITRPTYDAPAWVFAPGTRVLHLTPHHRFEPFWELTARIGDVFYRIFSRDPHGEVWYAAPL